jgi:hypothetical protein
MGILSWLCVVGDVLCVVCEWSKQTWKAGGFAMLLLLVLLLLLLLLLLGPTASWPCLPSASHGCDQGKWKGLGVQWRARFAYPCLRVRCVARTPAPPHIQILRVVYEVPQFGEDLLPFLTPKAVIKCAPLHEDAE